MSEERLIVVAAEDACGFGGEVGAQLGRSPFLLLAEAEGKTVSVSQVVPNPFLRSHGTGPVGRLVREMGAEVVIAGDMGPQAIEMFHGFGIDVATGATGSVAAVLGAYLRGEHFGVMPCAGNPKKRCGGDGHG